MRPNYVAQLHRIRTSPVTVPIWEQKCCRHVRWSAARRCDRCGTAAESMAEDLTIAEVLAGFRFTPVSQPVASVPTLDVTPPSPPIAASTVPVVEPPPPQPDPPLATTSTVGPRRPVGTDEDDGPTTPIVPARSNEDAERALVFGLWLAAGAVACMMGLGTLVEFEEGNYVRSFFLGLGASAAPVSVLTMALDGLLTRAGPMR